MAKKGRAKNAPAATKQLRSEEAALAKEVAEATQENREAEKASAATKQELKEDKAAVERELTEREKLRAARLAGAKAAADEIRLRMVTLITTALALVAGLFWQTAINDTIKTFIPVSGAWQYEIIVALVVTIAAAIAIYLLSKPVNKDTPATDAPGKPAPKA
jgi:hypothetical protein